MPCGFTRAGLPVAMQLVGDKFIAPPFTIYAKVKAEERLEEATMMYKRQFLSAFLLLSLPAITVHAEKRYGPGVTDSEIKIGQTMPYSGPASGYSTLGKAEAAYFAKINDEGGINGRKIRFISVDDGFSPPKTVEQTRRLVESEEVLLMFGSCCTAANTAVHKYMNAKKVPQLFIATTALKWDDPQHYPWTMAMLPTPKADAPLYARYLLEHYPNARLGILYQNDDFGKDYVKSWKDDPATKSYLAWMTKYYPDGDPAELFNVAGYAYAYVLVHVLKHCGDDLTRENAMKQAANLRDLEPPMILPGLKLNTTPTDYTPLKQMYLRRFNGKHWAPLAE